MYHDSNLPAPPDKLIEYIQSNIREGAKQIRRRAVLSWSPSDRAWVLICCTVEAYPDFKALIEPVPSRAYLRAILFEDWLTPHTCEKFIEEIQGGAVIIAETEFQRSLSPNWQLQLVPSENDYMRRSGFIAITGFEERRSSAPREPLIAADQPYYPDIDEAANDWLPMKKFHGDQDGRRGQFIFILPEPRAYFTDVEHDKGLLTVSVDGTEVGAGGFCVKGVYWHEEKLGHFEGLVNDKKIQVEVPDGVSRFEYVLIDLSGQVYDIQRESKFEPSPLRRRGEASVTRDLLHQVESARSSAEGAFVEFKPFVRLTDGMGTKDNKTKLREVVMTAVSFANTRGGQIFLGIGDDCDIKGINEEVKAWSQSDLSNGAERYRGSLLAAIKNNIEGGEVKMHIAPVFVGEALIMVISIEPGATKPVHTKGDLRYFVRVGPNNKQIAPSEWHAHIVPPAGGSAVQFSGRHV